MAQSEQLIRGVGVSTGIAHGPAYVLACSERAVAPRLDIDPGEVDSELARFEAAVDRAEGELLALRDTVGQRLGSDHGDIFTAQALVLRDAGFRTPIVAAVRDRHLNVEAAIIEVIDRFSHAFENVSDPYLRERAADIRDVGRRVMAALSDCRADDIDVPDGAIVVAEELLPSVTARLETEQVGGFVTERGSKFSHGSILARSMGTPAVAGIAGAVNKIKNGDHLVVDGVSGLVFVNPRPSVRAEYERLAAELEAYRQDLQQLVDLPAVTLDGTAIGLFANVSKFADTEAALLYKAPGIGLYRTEFGFTVRSQFPTTDEQFEFLKRAAERFHPRRIVFRLLDVGGDKTLSYFPLPASRNPSLAQRGIRLLLAHPEILRSQLRAFLRVSAEHPISILLPMVPGIEEVRATRAIVAEVQEELAALGVAFDRQVPLGAMIEVPSAALMVPALSREVDFFSLGTNDLVQYVLAADREDETVAPYYQPLHPGVLRLIQTVAQGANGAARPLTICGELAGDPAYTELLVGLGLREMSVAPGEMLAVKDAIRRVDLPTARDLARQALELGSVAEVVALLAERRARASVITAPVPRRSQGTPG